MSLMLLDWRMENCLEEFSFATLSVYAGTLKAYKTLGLALRNFQERPILTQLPSRDILRSERTFPGPVLCSRAYAAGLVVPEKSIADEAASVQETLLIAGF